MAKKKIRQPVESKNGKKSFKQVVKDMASNEQQQQFQRAAEKGGKIFKGVIKGAQVLKKIIGNDEYWYNKLKKVTPAENTSRPMNPLANVDITKDPTMGSVMKQIDMYFDWIGIYESDAFNAICLDYLEQIRISLKSNLNYTIQEVKQYIVDAIALHIIGAQIKKQLQFRSYNTVDNPNLYQLLRRMPSHTGGYGVVSCQEIEYLTDANIANTIAKYDVAVDVHNKMVLLPKNLSEFIDHYFGLMFSSDKDDSNSQLINPILQNIEWILNDGTVQLLNTTSITPDNYLSLLNDFALRFGVITADLIKSQSGLTEGYLPHYAELKSDVYYDNTLIQALINAYTDGSSIVSDNYIRLDYLPDCSDKLTTYLFLGALQNKISNDFLNIPLFTSIGMSVKIQNSKDLEWQSGLTQGDEEVFNNEYISINLQTEIVSDAYTFANTTGKANLVSGELYPYTGDITSIAYTISKSNGTTNYALTNHFATQGTNSQHLNIVGLLTVVSIVDPATGERMHLCQKFTGEASFGYNRESQISLTPTSTYVAISQGNESGMHIYLGEPANTKYTVSGDKQFVSYNITLYLTKQQSNQFVDQGRVYSPVDLIILPDIDIITLSGISYTTSQYVYANASFNNMSSLTSIIVTAEGIGANISTNTGYVSLVPYMVDQLDFHIPIYNTFRTHVTIDDDPEVVTIVSNDLVKESYIPFWYNIHDLLPVAYEMMRSLLAPDRIRNELIK